MEPFDTLTDDEMRATYEAGTTFSPARELKRAWGVRNNHRNFLAYLRSRGIALRGSDDVRLDYPDNEEWSNQDWLRRIERLDLPCLCGCGKRVKVRLDQRYKGLPKYLKNHRGRGKPLSAERREKISRALTGRKMSEQFRQRRAECMRERWADPAYREEHIRMQIEINANPALRQKHREIMFDWLDKHPDHIDKLTKASIAWAKQNPHKKLEAAKLGHKALAGKKKRSSIEILLRQALDAADLPYEEEWDYEIGIADFKVGEVIIFADGDYWHGPSRPQQQEKDQRQTKHLMSKGFQVLRFWGSELRRDAGGCVAKIVKLLPRRRVALVQMASVELVAFELSTAVRACDRHE